MDRPLCASILDLAQGLTSPVGFAIGAFTLWMLVDAIRQKEWMWVFFLLVFPGFAAFCYFFYVYRNAPSLTRGFELPGAHDRKRIKQLQAQIHHLDKPHHHSQLGDIYFQQGKLELAESCYRAAMERDPQDIDTRAHFGQCLLRRRRPAEAKPLAALGEQEASIAAWQRVTESYSYPRARVQLAELYLAKGQRDLARHEIKEVLDDDPHAPAFQRRRERVWIKRAKRLARQLG